MQLCAFVNTHACISYYITAKYLNAWASFFCHGTDNYDTRIKMVFNNQSDTDATLTANTKK